MRGLIFVPKVCSVGEVYFAITTSATFGEGIASLRINCCLSGSLQDLENFTECQFCLRCYICLFHFSVLLLII